MAGTVGTADYLYDRPGPLPEARDIVVPRASVAVLAASFRQTGLIENALGFRAAVAVTRLIPAESGRLHAAELRFPAHASLRQVLATLRHGQPVQHLLTIPEGLTAAQIALILDRSEPLSGEDAVPPEAGLLPQTYAFPRGTGRTILLDRAARALDRALTIAWSNRTANLPLATPREALILASIVERETARPDERPHIAAVFLNRLRLGMKLQSDPTVAYAADGGLGALDRPLGRADLDLDNPYNTYRYPGLPPGPICAPGLAAIAAVLRPTLSQDLYFVADGSGGHAFAATLEDHDRNVQRWRALH